MMANVILICLFIASFLIYRYVALHISHQYGAEIKGEPTILKDHTGFILAIPQIGLALNVIIVFYSGTYKLFPLIIGFILIFVGMYFNLTVRKNLGKNWAPLPKTTEKQDLVTGGIYSKVRHPFYLSMLIIFFGIAFISWNSYSLLFFILATIGILIRIKKEENELIAKFKENYEEYAKKTPMLIPKLK